MVLLTKGDLAGAAGLAQARAVIAQTAPRAVPIVELAEGAADPRVILGLNAAAEDDIAARPSHHDGADDHEHDDFASTVVPLGEIADPAELAARIERLAREHGVLRVKGHVAVAGKPMRLLVQAVGARVRHQYDRPGAPAKRAPGSWWRLPSASGWSRRRSGRCWRPEACRPCTSCSAKATGWRKRRCPAIWAGARAACRAVVFRQRPGRLCRRVASGARGRSGLSGAAPGQPGRAGASAFGRYLCGTDARCGG
jgi:G3E family GTPase